MQKISIETLAELLWIRITGGFPNDEVNITEEEVELAVRMAAMHVMKKAWYEKNNGFSEFTDNLTTAEKEFEVKKESQGGHNFLNLPTEIVDLPKSRGVTRVALLADRWKDLPYLSHPNLCLKNTISWFIRGGRVYLISGVDEEIPCDFVITMPSVDEVPNELKLEIFDMARQMIMGSTGQKDDTNNQNATV